MCSSKCFAKPEKMSLLDILKMRGDFAKSKEKDVESVRFENEIVNISSQDYDLLKTLSLPLTHL